MDDIFYDDYEGATKLSVSDYARYRKTTPQLIHYYLRNRIIERENCLCGRPVIDVQSADAALSEHKKGRSKTL